MRTNIRLAIVVLAVAAFCGFGVVSAGRAAPEKGNYLADRHADLGTCETCHEDAAPPEDDWVDPEKCMGCHEGWDELAAKTESWGEYNPHKSHLGEPDCTLCHKGHEDSVNYCATCHKVLDLKMK